MAERRRLRWPSLAALGAIVLGTATLGCAEDPPDPAEERRERVAERLEATFSGQQASCILDRLDDATLIALDGPEGLDEGSDELAGLSGALAACVVGEPDEADGEADPGAPEPEPDAGAESDPEG